MALMPSRASKGRLSTIPTSSRSASCWGDYINKSARDILEEIEGKEEQAERKKRKAVAFLTEALKGGPRMAAEVIAEGAALGFNDRALRRAFTNDLKGQSERVGFGKGGTWIWELPGGTS